MTPLEHQIDSALKCIRSAGDPVERWMAEQHRELAHVLKPYAVIWHTHLYPRRDDKQLWQIDHEWIKFAGSHYSALIRTHQASCHHQQIQIASDLLCEDESHTEALLSLNDATEAFWNRTEQAIDYLGFAFQDAPFACNSNSIDNLKHTWQRPGIKDRTTLLKYYGRIPSMAEKNLYTTKFARQWQAFLDDISASWWELQDWLATQCEPAM